ncbi:MULTISPECIES: RNA polymerase sigma-I factor [Bacillaceae]|uniref:RNA polymerase sigma factor SigI n=1 Tax=Evansella alkalicola TaxID=745819 RepID=A0ABS6K2C7_9BACI|nr:MULTISPECIES: RNA polymerase sigma-I factor [Bacillaceae]MBU9723885.1 RNA polymerase sigma-I factor [Bacillus alkalicola]
MLKRLLSREQKNSSVEDVVAQIQAGDESERNNFIEQYIPFIRKTTSKVCKKYLTTDDDEYSIALMAFNEAIHQYSPEKGHSFLAFASLVVKRRVIDYIRYEQRRRVTLSIDYTEDDKENMENVAEVHAAVRKYEVQLESEARREEIILLQKTLSQYGISLAEVSKQSPKHKDARENMLDIAKTVVNNDEFKLYLIEKKRLPMKQLTTNITMSRKTIERNRKYIIALCIILLEDFKYLQDYLRGWLG